MPLSPFRARLALGTFLAISGGVAANLLGFQKQSMQSPQVRARADKARLAMDSERLRRLSLEAVTNEPGSAGSPTLINGRDPSSSGAVRVGSFSPSSSHLARSALPGANPLEARRATTLAVQSELERRGYQPGAADGTPGLVTRAAVLAYEYDQGLPITADPSPEVLAHLRHGSSAPGIAIGLDGPAAGKAAAGHAETVIRAVQQSLRALGYLTAVADGQSGDETVRAIREFEMDAGMVPTGRISAPLVVRLSRQLNSKAKS